MIEKFLLGYERTLIAWTKAATHLLIFGFSIYKLLESKLHETSDHPILDILTPRRIAIILFISGFFALLMATIRFVQVQKRFNKFSWRTYFLPSLVLTVDGDTSTSDTALLFATGTAGVAVTAHSPEAAAFHAALTSLMIELAQLIVMDGEGAQKLITIRITGAESDEAARRIGLAIGNSPLVKTAVAGEDANWGRIVMAVGKSGERVERDLLKVSIGGVVIAEQGERVAAYDDAPVAAHMKTRDIALAVDIGLGQGSATVWSCDLTHGYIDINADYRS